MEQLAAWRDGGNPESIRRAKQEYESASRIAENAQAIDLIVFNRCNAAICDSKLGSTEAAIVDLEKLITKYPENGLILLVYSELGFIYQRAWRANDAERCLAHAERLAASIPNFPDAQISQIKLSRAINFATLGKVQQSRIKLDELAENRSKLIAIEAKTQLAMLDFFDNRPYLAIDKSRECLQQLKSVQPRGPRSIQLELSNHMGLAFFYRSHGRFTDGKKELVAARNLITQNAQSLSPFQYKRSLNELDKAEGELLVESTWAAPNSTQFFDSVQQDLLTASQYADNVLKRLSDAGKASEEAASCYNLLANIAWRKGILLKCQGNQIQGNSSLQSAIDYFDRAIQLYDSLSPDLPIIRESKRNRAYLGVVLGGAKNGLVFESKELLKDFQVAYGKETLPTVQCHDLLMTTHALAGDMQQALIQADISRRIYNAHLPRHAAGLTPIALQTFFRRWEEPALHSALRLTTGVGTQHVKAIEWLANGKAKSSEILAQSSQALSKHLNHKELDSTLQRQAALLYGADKPNLEESLLSLETLKRGNLEKLGVAVDAKESSWIELPQLVKHLRHDEVYIDIFALKPSDFDAKRSYFAWILEPSGKVDVVQLGDVEDIVQLINQFVNEIESFEDSADQAMNTLRELSQQVFEPLFERAGASPKWIVSPDGDLWNLPWAALILPDAENTNVDRPRYAVEKLQIRTVISGRDLLKRNAAKAQGPAVVVADPAFDDTRESLAEQWRDETSMVATPLATEGPQVFAQIQKSNPVKKPILLVHQDATSSKLFEMPSAPSLLYLATHGLFLERSDLPVEDPFLCCFLAFSGYNVLPKNSDRLPGVLTGSQVLLLNLQGTELVVLSACQTGIGISAYGHSAASLRHAFHLAGAHAVVASVWSVPSDETSALMLDFITKYHADQQAADPAGALQQAQLAYLKIAREKASPERQDVSHPYYWAAFTVSGF